LLDCVTVYNSDKKDPWANAMLAACLLRTNKAEKAAAYANYAFGKRPKSNGLKELAGYAFLISGNMKRAEKLIFSSSEKVKTKSLYRKKLKEAFCVSNKNSDHCVERSSASLFPKGVREKMREKTR